MTVAKKKLIEVALPLEAINRASAREGYIYRGNPSALHKWWAQRPLAAARAVIFAQMVDDPSEHPDLFPTEKAQEKERKRLFKIIEDLVVWENTSNEQVLQSARDAIWQSWRSACADNVDHPRAKDLFNRQCLPGFLDPFAGGGTLPLEAQRLGIQAHASDLNPVAVLINKAMIEIPPKFAGAAAVNPDTKKGLAGTDTWKAAEGLADDIRYYGHWMVMEAQRRIGKFYPSIRVTDQLAKDRKDLKPLLGKDLVPIAWLWARTVKSPHPPFTKVDVPLASTFMLSTKAGKEKYVEAQVDGSSYQFHVRIGIPKDANVAKNGTKLSRGASFRCVMSQGPVTADYIREQAKAGRMGAKLMAVVVESDLGRTYLSPSPEMEAVARKAKPEWQPDVEFFQQALGFRVGNYGMTKWSDLFTPRQLLALTTFSGLVQEAREQVRRDAVANGLKDDGINLKDGGTGATAYAEAVSIYLAFAQDKAAEYGCTLVPWYSKEDRPKGLFSRQAVPMVWDFAEVNPLASMGGTLLASVGIVGGALGGCAALGPPGVAQQLDAARGGHAGQSFVVSTDPPYYDNVGYADLSDFFYVWLRYSLRSVFPELFGTLAVPKSEELVATPVRHGSDKEAEAFFLDGMTRAMQQLAYQTHPAFPVTIYYAFKQSETDGDAGTTSTGWETFLDAVIRAGFSVDGTWPMRTERSGRIRDMGSNALASSIVLVCRPRSENAGTATRRDFVTALKAELPKAVRNLQRGNIAPVDLAQAAIGPGMSVYTRYVKVLDADGTPMPVREALALINETLDECLAEQEGDFDADTRWALAWFEEFGFAEGDYGVAETLSKAKNTSVKGLGEAGILRTSKGKVRLLKAGELPADWDPTTDTRLTAWEVVHHLTRALDARGELGAAALAAKLGAEVEVARELAYRLFTLCERKKRAPEALVYNALVQSWPEIARLAREGSGVRPAKQAGLFDKDEE